MKSEIVSRIYSKEDAFCERKPESVNDREIRKELVAFANSTPSNKKSVLFIGVSDDGKILGVTNPDEKQKKIRKIAEHDCYPPVSIQIEVLTIESKDVLAVIVPDSNLKPHFSGPAYIRLGSESKNATAEEYEKLINSRNDKCREINNNLDKIFTVRVINKKLGEHGARIGKYEATQECRVIECNQHLIRLEDISLKENFSEPLINISIAYDEKKYRPMLIIREN